MGMRLPKLFKEDYESGAPIITIARVKHPDLHDVEIPLDRARPRLLKTPKGYIAEYLIQYGNYGDEDPVVFTRKCLYVDKETWEAVKKQYDDYCGRSMTT